jgi:hypothetical protein
VNHFIHRTLSGNTGRLAYIAQNRDEMRFSTIIAFTFLLANLRNSQAVQYLLNIQLQKVHDTRCNTTQSYVNIAFRSILLPFEDPSFLRRRNNFNSYSLPVSCLLIQRLAIVDSFTCHWMRFAEKPMTLRSQILTMHMLRETSKTFSWLYIILVSGFNAPSLFRDIVA